MATCDFPAPVAANPSTTALQQLKELLQRDPGFAQALAGAASTEDAVRMSAEHGVQVTPEALWRDWGWAPEYVEAMHRILQAEEGQDYVIASGMTHSLRKFVDAAFAYAGLEPQGRLEVNSGLMRPTDLSYSAIDPGKIERDLGWKATLRLEAVVARMMDSLIP